VCSAAAHELAFRTSTTATEGGVDAERFRPASDDFGATVATVVRCTSCGHGSLEAVPDESAVALAYEEAEDPVSVREEPGQVATADRDLAAVEATLGIGPGAPDKGRLLDVGCWTGSFVAAAQARGWAASGIEPSAWAVARARTRGIDVHQAQLGDDRRDVDSYRVVVACDVLEHLLDPAAAVAHLRELVEPGGALFITVPDAGSRLARVLGARWWSVLPMHVQYFTRGSLQRLLERHGFEVEVVRTHAKLFSRRYSVERLAAFLPVGSARLERLGGRLRSRDRLIGPDLRDRMAVIAVRRDESGAS
jgi:SAM-dependent methyltransferase